MRIAILALCALPTCASSVTLDPGDLGVHWVQGVGFRPVDGVDSYGGGKATCQQGRARKDLEFDRVQRVNNCSGNQPSLLAQMDQKLSPEFSGGTRSSSDGRAGIAASEGVTEKAAPAVVTGLSDDFEPFDPVDWPDVGGLSDTKDDTPQEQPTLASAPLPASLWMLAIAAVVLLGVSRRS